jgi:hypothetical protein
MDRSLAATAWPPVTALATLEAWNPYHPVRAIHVAKWKVHELREAKIFDEVELDVGHLDLVHGSLAC